MKLSPKTEWTIIGVLIVIIAFVPPMQNVRAMMNYPLSKAVALGAVVYVWKYVSPIISILLLVLYFRCTSMSSIWERFSGAETQCYCVNPAEFTWDESTKKCKNSKGEEGKVDYCVCASGYTWDGGAKGTQSCIAVTEDQPPIPPTANPVAEQLGPSVSTPAPAVTKAPVTSTAPITTPGEAQQMASSATPMATPTGGVQAGAGTTSTVATL